MAGLFASRGGQAPAPIPAGPTLGNLSPNSTGSYISGGLNQPINLFNPDGTINPQAVSLWSASQQSSQAAQEFNVNETDKQAILNSLFGLTTNLSGTQLGQVSSSDIAGAGGGGAPVTPYSPTADDKAATAAAFTQAKQNVSDSTQAAMTGLTSALQARGMYGGGALAKGITGAYEQGEKGLSDASAAEAGQQASQAFTANENTANRTEQAREFDTGQANQVAEFNAGNKLQAGEFNVNTALGKLTALTNAYKGLY